MIKTTSLEYARPTVGRKRSALLGLAVGVLGSPIGIAIAIFLAQTFPGGLNAFLAIVALAATVFASFLFSFRVRSKLPVPSRRRDRAFANLGIAAPVVWLVVMLGFYVFICFHC